MCEMDKKVRIRTVIFGKSSEKSEFFDPQD